MITRLNAAAHLDRLDAGWVDTVIAADPDGKLWPTTFFFKLLA